MGASASLPEKVLICAQKNDYCGFQALVADFGAAGLSDPAARARVLEHRDRSGRTPLLVCAAKNHTQLLQALLALGANVHYINPQRDAAGGALHEAAARRHEGAVQILLSAGANPFVANAAGRTAMDEAVLSGHAGVVRAMERCAEFTGVVAFKTRSMGGLTHKYKERWAVLFPYYPYHHPAAGEGASGTASVASSAPSSLGGASSVAAGSTGGAPPPPPACKARRCLWLYKDSTSISPRCRLWVDGAAVATHGPGGTEATLRLHTSHGEPVGDLLTRYEGGHCAALRPADLTPAAAATYSRLIALINNPPPLPPAPSGSMPARGAGAAAVAAAAAAAVSQSGGNAGPAAAPAPRPPAAAGPTGSYYYPQPAPPAPPPPPPPPPPPHHPAPPPGGHYPAVPPMPSPVQPPPYYPAPGGYGSPPGPYPVSPAAAAAAAPPPPYPYGAAGPCIMASPLSLYLPHHYPHPQQPVPHAQSPPLPPQPSRPAPGYQGPVPAAAAAAHMNSSGGPPTPAGHRTPNTSTPRRGRDGGGEFGDVDRRALPVIEHMAALPGETDEEFAARLASAISATSGHSQDALYPAQQQQQHSASQWQTTPPRPSGGHTPLTGTTPQQAATPAAAAAAATANGNGGQSGPYGNFVSPASHDGPGGPIHGARPLPAASSSPAPATSPAPHRRSDPLADLDIEAVNSLIAAQAAAQASASATAAGAASAAAQAGAASASAATSAPSPHSAAKSEKEASAPPLAPPQPPAEPASDDTCIICLSAPKEVGFLHGDSVHRCVCRGCCGAVPVGAPCPLCRQPVERWLGVY